MKNTVVIPAKLETSLGPSRSECMCGHPGGLHDGFGCAAFLGGFPETQHTRRYCDCTQFVDIAAAPPVNDRDQEEEAS